MLPTEIEIFPTEKTLQSEHWVEKTVRDNLFAKP